MKEEEEEEEEAGMKHRKIYTYIHVLYSNT